jgi:hypothetical protein
MKYGWLGHPRKWPLKFGKSSINGEFPMAMFDDQKVYITQTNCMFIHVHMISYVCTNYINHHENTNLAEKKSKLINQDKPSLVGG